MPREDKMKFGRLEASEGAMVFFGGACGGRIVQ